MSGINRTHFVFFVYTSYESDKSKKFWKIIIFDREARWKVIATRLLNTVHTPEPLLANKKKSRQWLSFVGFLKFRDRFDKRVKPSTDERKLKLFKPIHYS